MFHQKCISFSGGLKKARKKKKSIRLWEKLWMNRFLMIFDLEIARNWFCDQLKTDLMFLKPNLCSENRFKILKTDWKNDLIFSIPIWIIQNLQFQSVQLGIPFMSKTHPARNSPSQQKFTIKLHEAFRWSTRRKECENNHNDRYKDFFNKFDRETFPCDKTSLQCLSGIYANQSIYRNCLMPIS